MFLSFLVPDNHCDCVGPCWLEGRTSGSRSGSTLADNHHHWGLHSHPGGSHSILHLGGTSGLQVGKVY